MGEVTTSTSSNIFAIHPRETTGPDRAFPPSGRKLEVSKGIQGTRKGTNLLSSHSAPSMEDRETAGHHMETSKPRRTPIPIPSFTKIGLPTPIIPSFTPQCFDESLPDPLCSKWSPHLIPSVNPSCYRLCDNSDRSQSIHALLQIAASVPSSVVDFSNTGYGRCCFLCCTECETGWCRLNTRCVYHERSCQARASPQITPQRLR